MALEELAERFPQLYVAPAEDAEEAYKAAAARGETPRERSLAHFEGDERDWFRVEHTPAGPVETLFLARRQDFETFLRCVTRRCRPDAIAPTIGAMTIGGLPDWGRIRQHEADYRSAGGDDWGGEFRRFVADPTNYRVTMVIISEGPYSALDAAQTPFSPEEWVRVSREIRLYHELAHVTCRRLMPDDKPPIWDEITADMHGLLRATGGYDLALALRFLGIVDGSYVGGRLEEYLSEEQTQRLDQVAQEVARACEGVARAVDGADPADSYELLLELKRNPLLSY